MRTGIFHKSLWLLLSAVVAGGVWLDAQRVLVSYQMADAAVHERPRGSLSDLYPRWLGARELLLHRRDPYSRAITREIQQGYYGRALDPARAEDPRDQQGFAYPIYVSFCLAPTIYLPFEIVRQGFFWVLLGLTVAAVPLWLRVLHWSVPWWVQTSLVVLTIGSLPVMQGLKLQQMTLFVAALLAIALSLLTSDRPIAAGIVLALATIKPQLVMLLLCWLMIWPLADWHRRYRWAISFLVTVAVLLAASEWYLPHWIPRFWQAIREYQNYTGAKSVMDTLIGPPWSWALEFLALAALAGVCWKERRQGLHTEAFAFVASLALAETILLIPTESAYNQVLLMPSLLVLVKHSRKIWHATAGRFLFSITAALVLWPWISSLVLAVVSLVLPRESVEHAWAIPFWTVTQIPVGVAALMLVHYYRETFGTLTGSATS